MNPNQVRHWCRETFRYYVVFTNSIFFILGLILSYKLVEKTFLNILITRLTGAWEVDDLRRAVVVVNLHEGTTLVLVPLFAYVADVYTGRFLMVVFSTAVCIVGLSLNSLATGNDDNGKLDLGLFYPALGLMALAKAAQSVTLQAFLGDQLSLRDVDDDDERQRHTKFWWTLVSFVAAILAQLEPLTGFHFRIIALVLIAVMGSCLLVFLLGFKYYKYVPRIQDPFKDLWIVIIRAIANRNIEHPENQEPLVPWLRWLDRASEAGSLSSAAQVRGVKLLLNMFPLWSCFLTLSLVAASGSTFFFEEASSLAENDDLFPIFFLANLMRFTEFAASETSSYVVRKLRERKQYNQQRMELVRIGIGMFCCMLCCVVAWVTATCRQLDAGDTMSVYWLSPQYFLLGLIAGLSEDGLQSFYESQVSESLSTYGPPFGEFVTGVGKFMSILCIFIFTERPFRWFQKNLDDSRLNKYYILLAVLSFGNVVIYFLVACWYRPFTFLVDRDEEMVGLAQQAGQLLASPSIEEANRSLPYYDVSNVLALSEPTGQEEEIGIAQQAADELLASPSLDGQRISRRSVSRTRESNCGDDVAESSGSRQEAEITSEDLPLAAESNMNNSTNNFVLLRAVTAFLGLSSRAARRRADPAQLKEE